MTPRIEDRYFEWLYGLVASVKNRNPARSYWDLARVLYSTEFVWLVANDDNRVSDGIELREEFMSEQGSAGVDKEWLNLGCSVLEMLIALSRRASFESDKEPDEWFGTFLQNLGLLEFTEANWKQSSASEIDRILERFIYRNYDHAGNGGLFPLRYPHEDQRKVELWYQLASYLMETSPI